MNNTDRLFAVVCGWNQLKFARRVSSVVKQTVYVFDSHGFFSASADVVVDGIRYKARDGKYAVLSQSAQQVFGSSQQGLNNYLERLPIHLPFDTIGAYLPYYDNAGWCFNTLADIGPSAAMVAANVSTQHPREWPIAEVEFNARVYCEAVGEVYNPQAVTDLIRTLCPSSFQNTVSGV